ncbi:MAG: sugar transferase [Deltaproteobacteria bacterium]|nr:sugar transferase [Deltaproteobacteria bacterium]
MLFRRSIAIDYAEPLDRKYDHPPAALEKRFLSGKYGAPSIPALIAVPKVVPLTEKSEHYRVKITRKGGSYAWQKRAIDVLGAVSLLVLCSPLILITALLVLLSSGRPVLLRQRRLTEGGRIFTMYKFRSMQRDAEAGTGAVMASKSDPRITPIGRILRRTRLDELPQLVNVLRGEMSLIGPRPERPEIAVQLARVIPCVHRRLAVKAGLTGLAQVLGGYSSSVEEYREKVAWDLLYVRRRSLKLDIFIAFKTVSVVLSGSGAR